MSYPAISFEVSPDRGYVAVFHDHSPQLLPSAGEVEGITVSTWHEAPELFVYGRVPALFYWPRTPATLTVDEAAMRESQVESSVVNYARKHDIDCKKFSSPSKRSVPDVQFNLTHGRCFYIEFKRPGGKPTAAQEREIEKLCQRGFHVYICDDRKMGRAIVDLELKMHELLYGGVAHE